MMLPLRAWIKFLLSKLIMLYKPSGVKFLVSLRQNFYSNQTHIMAGAKILAAAVIAALTVKVNN